MQLSMHLFMFVLIEHKDIKFQTCETVVQTHTNTVDAHNLSNITKYSFVFF